MLESKWNQAKKQKKASTFQENEMESLIFFLVVYLLIFSIWDPPHGSKAFKSNYP
jgi:hypothetical protein